MEVFALLDDAGATAERPTSRLYTGFVREHRCADPATLEAVWQRCDADLRAGLQAVLLADYEWGAKLLHAGDAALAADDGAALRVLMFERCERLCAGSAGKWLAARATAADEAPCGTLDLHPSVDRAAFEAAIGRIHEAIAAGETYQVNYTYRLHGRAFGTPLALYRALRARQPVRYAAFIALPAGDGPTHVLSLSPELFVRHEGGTLTARPMKGTAPRIRSAEGDSETARLLALDVKNRAENLMIVDLLRNDLGRVAQTGSVRVPELFAIEPYATVFQMTSTVQARLRDDAGMPELLRAIFPCGSITGAPKHHTMQLIARLESTPRGLYCGAIGWVDAPPAGARVGDFCFSVAIRTATLGAEREGTRALTMGVGAGIVKDSRAADEFDECRLKARFLTGLDPGFGLIETMRREADGTIPRRAAHLARLARSAGSLGFAFDQDGVAAALDRIAAAEAGHVLRVRLLLRHDGTLAATHDVLLSLAPGDVLLRIAPDALPGTRPLAGHKTTLRAQYDAGVRAAEQAGAFDALFFTSDGRLVEGGRSSVFVRLDGRWWTPPLHDGALPGVARAALLADPAWAAGERTLRLDDLARAEALVVCNALRGVLPARIAAGDLARAA